MSKCNIAIIGAGLAGLSCALECERLGVIAEVFERLHSVGWGWQSVISCYNVVNRPYGSDPVKHLKDFYDITIKPAKEVKVLTLKSPNAETKIEPNKLGFSFYRGKEVDSVENQLLRELRKTPIHYNALSNYKELSQKYDYVVVASGSDYEARELGVWEDQLRVSIMGAVALGSFAPDTSTIYFDTEYAGWGYGRVTPFSDSEALLGLYFSGKGDFSEQQENINQKFEQFLNKEGLNKLQLVARLIVPPFIAGKVSRFRVGNILLAGRAAGLIDRSFGFGTIEALISGVLAARAIIRGEDYDKMLKPLQEHIENLSVFRKYIEKLNNSDLDRMVSFIGTAGVEQLIYDINFNLLGIAGNIARHLL